MALTTSVAAIPGTLIGLALFGSDNGPYSLGCLNYAMLGALGGMMIGAPVGVWAGARLAGGKGTLSGAFAGTAVGAGAGFATAYLVPDTDLKPLFITVVPLLGAIVGYELSHAANSRREQAPAVNIQPTLALGPDHTLLGMSGQF